MPGTHPFLLGLHRALTSNMENTAVIGWKSKYRICYIIRQPMQKFTMIHHVVQDAVFVESGGSQFNR